MKTFPMFLCMEGRKVVVCGGGEEAARKARLVLKTEARLILAARHLDPELTLLVGSGRAEHVGEPAADTFEGAALAFIGTGDEAEDERLAAMAKSAGAVVNVIDRPDLCDAFTPSIVDRDPVVVAIGTEGTAPVLGRMIRTDIESRLDPRLGSFAAMAGQLRDAVAEAFPPHRRRAFWEWAFQGAPFRAFREGATDRSAVLLGQAIAERQLPAGQGHIALVGAGPGARDLLTLRAVARLQEADVIFYDRLVEPEVLELARRDAERVFVGKHVGACAWPQDKINSLIVAEALKGRRVVRLKSGDPAVFGRASEEIACAREAGVPVEIVPGITAVSAAAASVGASLTERGETDTLVLTTGTCRPGDPAPDWAAYARPGTTMAFYMSVGQAGQIRQTLAEAGVPADSRVEIVASASCAAEKSVTTTLCGMEQAIALHGIKSPAVILLRHSKARQAAGPARHRPTLPAARALQQAIA